MSYTVLARKWRPRQFEQMIGQEHVLRALIHALDGNRLHHAYLFTGTRGVGKTTVARVLAKALNCETGITSRPCGQCQACLDIDQGRFLDLIEVDAASRTKVDDTRELLDNVQYAPSRGRFKIYLIDEVHMLSTHSFNALLKTLEEPPPHVKFLLATTDPKKLPVTVLSRCLQFHLRRLPADAIAQHLAFLCGEESIDAEERALQLLAAAAQGSVRDALSLLDQAIAHGAGKIVTAEVADMLGSVDHDRIERILHALAEEDGAQLLAQVAQLDEHVPDYDQALVELAAALQRIAVIQVVGDAKPGAAEADALRQLGERFSAEDVQLYYQIALLGRQELALAADPRGAFEMTLLRMLAFRPSPSGRSTEPGSAERARPAAARGAELAERLRAADGGAGADASRRASASATERADAPTAAAAPSMERTRTPAPPAGGATERQHASETPTAGFTAPARAADFTSAHSGRSAATSGASPEVSTPGRAFAPYPTTADSASDTRRAVADESSGNGLDSAAAPAQDAADGAQEWSQLIGQTKLSGGALQLARHCVLRERHGTRFHLLLDAAGAHMNTAGIRSKLEQALSEHLGAAVRLQIDAATEEALHTPAREIAQQRDERLREAQQAMQADPNVRALQEAFDATLHLDSVRPID